MGNAASRRRRSRSGDAPKGVKTGWLIKQGRIVKSWRKRQFELDAEEEVLRYKDEKGDPRGAIPLRGVWIARPDKAVTG